MLCGVALAMSLVMVPGLHRVCYYTPVPLRPVTQFGSREIRHTFKAAIDLERHWEQSSLETETQSATSQNIVADSPAALSEAADTKLKRFRTPAQDYTLSIN